MIFFKKGLSDDEKIYCYLELWRKHLLTREQRIEEVEFQDVLEKKTRSNNKKH